MPAILAAIDLSPASDEVLRAASLIVARTGAALHLVHACGLPYSAFDGMAPGMPPVDDGFQSRLEQAEAALRESATRVAGPSIEVASARVVADHPHRAINERAAEVGAELIVMGPHRHTPLDSRLLGTTADRVVRTASVPCLVVRCYFNLPLHRVVVPVDLSEPAAEALDLALEWLSDLGPREAGAQPAELRVIHVLPATSDLPSGRATLGPRLRGEVTAALERGGHRARVHVREELIWGESRAGQIVRYAADERAGLLVMATHGRGAVERALIGSVTSAVARDAPCCVLLVPPRRWTRRGR